MFNANQLITQLAQLPDTALQQYAAMHKNDPYSLALAVSESNRRKAMRAAAQPPAPTSPPPVADVAIMEMAAPPQTPQGMLAPEADTETMGIAAGAPDDVAEMAEGGIVGYAEGGSTAAEMLTAEPERSVNPLWWLSPEELGRRMRGGKSIEEYYGRLPPQGLAAAADSRELAREGRRTSPMETSDRATVAPDTGKVAPATSAKPTGLAAAAASRAPGQAPSQDVADLYAPLRKQAEGLEARTRALGEQNVAAEEANVAELEAAQKGSKYGEETEARLKAEQGKLGGEEKESRRMALIQAGLSILAADPSRGAFAAIGEGALKGFTAYKGDKEKLAARRDKINEQLEMLDNKRFELARLDGKELREAKRSVRQARMGIERDLIALGREVGLPLGMAEAKAVIDAREKALDRQNQLRVASTYAAPRAGAGGKTQLTPAQYEMAVRQLTDQMLKNDMSGRYVGPRGQEMARREAMDQIAAQYESVGVKSPANPYSSFGIGPPE